MAEMMAGSRPDGKPPERDVLLATKLQLPRARPGLVARPRLADQLGEGLNRGLVLVTAPAGYGKSVLVSEWARSMAQPVAWLSLDGGDNDPVRFWRHVLAALDSARPGIAERVGPLAGPPPPPTYEPLVSALINDFVAEPGLPEAVLVLDDYHLAGAGTVRPQAPRLVQQLTGRELEVLTMLAAGRSNQNIASHLVVSLDTVKKHVSHLLGKLGAANRTEAVARGRELGLID